MNDKLEKGSAIKKLSEFIPVENIQADIEQWLTICCGRSKEAPLIRLRRTELTASCGS